MRRRARRRADGTARIRCLHRCIPSTRECRATIFQTCRTDISTAMSETAWQHSRRDPQGRTDGTVPAITATQRSAKTCWGTIVPDRNVSYRGAARTIRVVRAAEHPEIRAHGCLEGSHRQPVASQQGRRSPMRACKSSGPHSVRCHDGRDKANLQMEIRAEPDRSDGSAHSADAQATARRRKVDAFGGRVSVGGPERP